MSDEQHPHPLQKPRFGKRAKFERKVLELAKKLGIETFALITYDPKAPASNAPAWGKAGTPALCEYIQLCIQLEQAARAQAAKGEVPTIAPKNGRSPGGLILPPGGMP